MLDMNKRIKFLGVVLTGVCSLMLSGCSNNDEPRQQEEFVLSDPAQGYFLTPCGTTASRTLEAGGGEVDIPLASSMTEEVIPIHMIAPEKDMFRDSGKWGDAILRPGNGFSLSGNPADYPNSLDVAYRFGWAEFSTFKKPDSDEGILRIRFEPNPTEERRSIAVWLKNEQSSVIEVVQEPKSYVPGSL